MNPHAPHPVSLCSLVGNLWRQCGLILQMTKRDVIGRYKGSVLGSVQLFVAGVMGEYLGRLYIESKGRPLFVIKEVACSDELTQETSTASSKVLAP